MQQCVLYYVPSEQVFAYKRTSGATATVKSATLLLMIRI